jgi:hypothetical protein
MPIVFEKNILVYYLRIDRDKFDYVSNKIELIYIRLDKL